MENFDFIVGSAECPIKEIESIMRCPTILDKWSTLASELGVPNIAIKKFRQALLFNMNESDVLREVLETWVGICGSRARLITLINAVEKENEMGVGESLRIKFNLPCKGWESQDSPVSWSELSPAFQAKVTTSLEKIVPDHNDLQNLTSSLEAHTLVDLMIGRMPRMFKDSLPKELKYYVNRSLITRNCLDPKIIFEANHSSDIFLFTGMGRSKLSRMAKDQMTGRSSEQLRKVTARFLILDQAIHFDKISELTEESVHLLHYDNKRLRWIKSKGQIQLLRKCMEKNQDTFEDEEFASTFKVAGQHPICISDSPGMGKSILLAQIGRKLALNNPEKLVIFMSFNQLISLIKSKDRSSCRKDILKEVLREFACQNKLEATIFETKFSAKSISIELLLDGFDEVHSSDIKAAMELLQALQLFKNSIRVWVTTRPHYMEMIEDALNTLGYSISPFMEEDQVQFLVRFWRSTTEKKLNTNALEQFARDCLKNLKSTFKSREKDVDGIPLQCRLIGEVYEDEATNAADPEENYHAEIPTSTTVLISSTTDLYKFVIATKLQKYLRLHISDNFAGTQRLMDMHMRLSLELLFPEHFHKLKGSLQPVDMDEIVKVGIVEGQGSVDVPNFIHRTFAEYFVAWFVIDRLGGGRERQEWSADITNFIVQGVLACRKMDYELLVNEVWDIEGAKLKMGKQSQDSPEKGNAQQHRKKFRDLAAFQFVHPVICQFLNSFLKADSRLIFDKSSNFAEHFDQPRFLEQVASAGAYHDFFDILMFFDRMNLFEKHAREIFSGRFMIVVVLKSCLEFVKISFNYSKRHNNKELVEESGPAVLHVALLRGDFSIVEFLLKEKRLRQIVEESTGPNANFVHHAVKASGFNSEEQIVQRINIVRTLAENNPSFHVKQKDEDGNVPLFSRSVHVKLALELVQLGANVLATDRNGNTVIHMNANTSHYTNKDYHAMCMSIPQRKLRKLVQMTGQYNLTPLASTFAFFDPLPETLDILKDAGADFNHVDPDMYSVLFYAIFRGRSATTMEKLIELGADINHRGSNGETLLHTATITGNADAVAVLLKHGMDINAVKTDGGTPLDLLMFSDLPGVEKVRMEIGPLLLKRGGKFDQTVNAKGQTLLHIAARKGRTSSVALLLELDFDVNAKDEDGNTPLHYAIQEDDADNPNCIFDIVTMLFDYDADPNMTNDEGVTPFLASMKNEDVDLRTFQLLVSETDIDWTATLATAALEFIVSKNYTEKYLDHYTLNRLLKGCIDHGADVNCIAESTGISFLQWAAFNNNELAVKVLLERGADLTARSRGRWARTALHLATFAKEINSVQIEIIKCLIDHGAAIVHSKDGGNQTFLHCLLSRDNSPITPQQFHDIAEYLIEKNYENILNLEGGERLATPFQLAVEHLELEEQTLILLHTNGVNFNAADKDGKSVLSSAALADRSAELIALLIKYGATERLTD